MYGLSTHVSLFLVDRSTQLVKEMSRNRHTPSYRSYRDFKVDKGSTFFEREK